MRSDWPTTGSVSSKLRDEGLIDHHRRPSAAASAVVKARPRSRRRPDDVEIVSCDVDGVGELSCVGRIAGAPDAHVAARKRPLVVYPMARTRPSARMRASNASRKARRSAGPYLRCTSKRSSVMSVCGACGGSCADGDDEAAGKDTRGEQQQEAERHLRDDQAAAQARVARRHRAPAAAQMRRGVRTGRDEPGQQARGADHQHGERRGEHA